MGAAQNPMSALGWDRCTYVEGNPMTFVDPSGFAPYHVEDSGGYRETFEWSAPGTPSSPQGVANGGSGQGNTDPSSGPGNAGNPASGPSSMGPTIGPPGSGPAMGQPSLEGTPPTWTDEQKVDYLLDAGSQPNCGNGAMSCPGVGDYPSNRSEWYDLEIAAERQAAQEAEDLRRERAIKRDAVQPTADPLDLVPVAGVAGLLGRWVGLAAEGGGLVALDANAFRNLRTLRGSGALGAGDRLIVSPNVAAELARRGVSAADISAAGVRIATESPVGASVAATRIADVLRGLGGRGAASASADALNLAEASGLGAKAFITADRQILRAFGGTSIIPGTGGLSIRVSGF